MMYRQTKRSITLIEMMIVMFLITMIIGTLAFNYRGSLEKGKVFKTKATIDKVEAILQMAEAEGEGVNEESWKQILQTSPLVQRGGDLTKDGWGEELKFSRGEEQEIEVHSSRLQQYEREHQGAASR